MKYDSFFCYLSHFLHTRLTYFFPYFLLLCFLSFFLLSSSFFSNGNTIMTHSGVARARHCRASYCNKDIANEIHIACADTACANFELCLQVSVRLPKKKYNIAQKKNLMIRYDTFSFCVPVQKHSRIKPPQSSFVRLLVFRLRRILQTLFNFTTEALRSNIC